MSSVINAMSSASSTSQITSVVDKCIKPSNIHSTIQLNDSNRMPVLGLGVYLSHKGRETENAVYESLKAGYRHIDTAAVYQNEESVGAGLNRFLSENKEIKRDDIYIVTKFFPRPLGKTRKDVKAECLNSLKKLGIQYIDLYLIHAPLDADNRVEQWHGMEELKDEGLVRSIGVSNFGMQHLEELSKSSKYTPACNQIEVNPYITRTELCNYCNTNGIAVVAYSPLTKGEKLSDEKLVSVAKKYNATTAQILIKWCIQRGYAAIPKSVHPDRIIENGSVFHIDISTDDMKLLDSFDEYLVTGWDPAIMP